MSQDKLMDKWAEGFDQACKEAGVNAVELIKVSNSLKQALYPELVESAKAHTENLGEHLKSLDRPPAKNVQALRVAQFPLQAKRNIQGAKAEAKKLVK